MADDLSKQVADQTQGGFRKTGLQPTTGDTVTGQGPPVPTVQDFIARLYSGNPNANASNPNERVIIAPDTATNTRNANMDRYGTSFPGEKPMSGDPDALAHYRQWKTDNNMPLTAEDFPAVSPFVRGGRGSSAAGGAQTPQSIEQQILAQHRDAREEIANRLSVTKEAYALQHQAERDHNTASAFHDINKIDLNDPEHDKKLFGILGANPNVNMQELAPLIAARKEQRGLVAKALEAGGIDQFAEGSQARSAFQRNFTQTKDLNRAQAAAKEMDKAEKDWSTAQAKGFVHDDDLANPDLKLTNKDGSYNVPAMKNFIAKRASGEIPGAIITRANAQEARRVLNEFKGREDDLEGEDKSRFEDAKAIQEQYLNQTKPGGSAAAPAAKQVTPEAEFSRLTGGQ